MFLCDQWRDYEVLDTGDGEKLERWGGIVLRRPDPQVIWPKADPALWDAAQATYVRSDTGGGHWEFREKLPERWVIGLNNLKFYVKPTGFKHTGLFPEQAANWAFMQERIRAAGAWGRPPRVLNLFAYTGGATLACAAAGAHVTHVDAAKGMVLWARRRLSGASFAAATATTASSWTRPATAAVPAARCGSWKTSFTRWWTCARRPCRIRRCFS